MRGHVAKKGKRWYPVVFLGFDENGKRKYKWFPGHDTKRAAEKALAQHMQEVLSGTYVDAPKETFGAYLRRWLEDKETQVRYSTIQQYRFMLEKHVIPRLEKVELTKLKPQHLQRLYTELRDELSNRSIAHIHGMLHAALDRALKWGLVGRNVAEAVDPPKPAPFHGTTWTAEQSAEFLRVAETAEPRYFVGFALAIYTGMRKGEILALRWEDIDFTSRTLRVCRSLSWKGATPIFQEPKTERGRRLVAIPDELVRILQSHRARQAEEKLLMGSAYQDHGLVLARVDGRPIYPRTFDHAWERAVKHANVPKIRFHDLRHTHASLLLQQGVHPKIVSERLGHSTVSITLDIYSHVLPGLQKQAADDFASLIRQARASNQSSNQLRRTGKIET
jgi:integrase